MGMIHAFCIVWLALGKVSSADKVGLASCAQPFSGSEYILYGGHARSVFCDRRGELVGRRSAGSWDGASSRWPVVEREHAARNSAATKKDGTAESSRQPKIMNGVETQTTANSASPKCGAIDTGQN